MLSPKGAGTGERQGEWKEFQTLEQCLGNAEVSEHSDKKIHERLPKEEDTQS
jgi:hypothetical protein